MVDLRYPNITGASTIEQMSQMKTYLHQLVDQLQFAMNAIDTKNTSSVVISTPRSSASSESSKPTTVDGQAAFSAVKPFIIKSAEIVQAYYDEINSRLESEYVAQSDFGTFTEKNTQVISKNATDITQVFSNIQKIETDIGILDFYLGEVNAYIKTGEIDRDKDDLPIYGIEIRQNTTKDGTESYSKLARFTSDKLTFYGQNEEPLAYISGYKLYIINAEITGTLTIGGYVVETTHGIAFKWVGRG